MVVILGPWRRLLILWLVVSLACAPLAGCTPYGGGPAGGGGSDAQPVLAAIVIDGNRLARPEEGDAAVKVWRQGVALTGVRTGFALRAGDRVQTSPYAYAVVRWPSGSEAYFRPGSSAELGSLLKAVGEFFVKVRGRFAVDTEFVRSGAAGTAWLVHAQPNGAMTVTVFDGNVVIESMRRLWPPVTLGVGTMGSAYLAAPQPVYAPEPELQRTRDWVERIEKLVPAPRADSGNAWKILAIGALVIGILAARSGSHDRGGSATSSTTDSPGHTSGTPAPAPAASAPIRGSSVVK